MKNSLSLDGGVSISKKRGRPTTNFDKRAYQREYMRRRRAKAKAEKETRND